MSGQIKGNESLQGKHKFSGQWIWKDQISSLVKGYNSRHFLGNQWIRLNFFVQIYTCSIIIL